MRIDLGCGTQKKEGFIGIDCRKFDGVDVVCDLGKDTWPFADETVEEAHCSHMVEHLKPGERIHFVNELHRVMKKGATAQIATPHWSSCRAYGDLTHEWPPVSEFWFFYLDKDWRAKQAPHNDGYTCDFTATYGFGTGPAMNGRSVDYVTFAVTHYKEAAADMVATLTKR